MNAAECCTLYVVLLNHSPCCLASDYEPIEPHVKRDSLIVLVSSIKDKLTNKSNVSVRVSVRHKVTWGSRHLNGEHSEPASMMQAATEVYENVLVNTDGTKGGWHNFGRVTDLFLSVNRGWTLQGTIPSLLVTHMETNYRSSRPTDSSVYA